MDYYFKLQYRRWNRAWHEWGIPPVLGYLLLVAALVVGAILLFHRTRYAPWIIVGLVSLWLSRLSLQTRVDELGRLFGRPRSTYLRLLENAFLALPWMGFLLYRGAWEAALVLGLGALLGAFWTWRSNRTWTVPTPFGRHPFEFAVGTRQYGWGLLLLYALLLKGAQVGNGNLSAVALAGIWVVVVSFYSHPEPMTYVWWYRYSSGQFLWHKLSIALGYSLLLTLPATVLLLAIFGWAYFWPLLGIGGAGFFFIVLMILGKYSVFPNHMGLPHVIGLVIGLTFPPLLIGWGLVLYRRARANLDSILI